MAHDVFISYSTINRAVADEICGELENGGIRCWYAPRDIEPGASWAKAIMGGIRECRIFVLIFSSASNLSEQVLNEVTNAAKNRCVIIPFRIDSSEMCDEMSYYLASRHWLDMGNRPLAESVGELKKRIRTIMAEEMEKKSASAARTAPPSAGKPVDAVRTAPKQAQKPPEARWDDGFTPELLGIEIRPDSIVLGSLNRENKPVSKEIPLSETVLAGIPARNRVMTLTSHALKYIREHSAPCSSHAVCTVSSPYLSVRDTALVEQAAASVDAGRYAGTVKKVSAAALSLYDKVQYDGEGEFALVITFDGASCEMAIVQIGDGLVEIRSVIQRRITEDTPLSDEMFRRDVFKLLDLSRAKKIVDVFIPHGFPASCADILWTMFRVKAVRMDPDCVLRGLVLLSAARCGRKTDYLLLDATDYDILVNADTLLEEGVTFPASVTKNILYKTARKDHCVDIFIRKNNLFLDSPQAFRLSVQDVLEPAGRAEQNLEITAAIDFYGRLNFTIRNSHSGKEVKYDWNSICKLLLSP